MGIDLTGAPGAWIETRTGIHFDLVNPKLDCIDIIDIAHALSMLCRYVGHCRYFYSVAEHSIKVAQILPDNLKMAGLLHDAAEAYTGDMSRPMKRLMPDIAVVEEKILSVIFEKYNVPHHLLHNAQIKKADNILIATELRDLMSGDAVGWEMEHIDPLPDIIKPVKHVDAKYDFLHTFKEYQS